MTALVVVAHPRSEVLGAGGVISRMAAAGQEVHICILSGESRARKNRVALKDRLEEIKTAHEILGAHQPIIGHFPDIRFNTVAHTELVQFVERNMIKTQPEIVFTHHPNDLNDDHRQTSLACQAAARLFQRGADVPRLKGFYFMEILSATDWAFQSGHDVFRPNAFVALGEEHLGQKMKALAVYRDLMRPFPHPRSEEVIRGLSALRGGQAGMNYAEAFQAAYQDLEVLI